MKHWVVPLRSTLKVMTTLRLAIAAGDLQEKPLGAVGRVSAAMWKAHNWVTVVAHWHSTPGGFPYWPCHSSFCSLPPWPGWWGKSEIGPE